MKKPYAEACDQNGPHVLKVLKSRIPVSGDLLEIGSGTGQHAVMFARELPGINWYTSDLTEMHDGIRLWLNEAGLPNLFPPMTLDVQQKLWPQRNFDVVFTANTCHIMPQEAVAEMFIKVPQLLIQGGLFLIYGPFMYDGKHTADSNDRFDRWLRASKPHRGIRDVSWLREISIGNGLDLLEDIEMPANNRILAWKKQ